MKLRSKEKTEKSGAEIMRVKDKKAEKLFLQKNHLTNESNQAINKCNCMKNNLQICANGEFVK